MTTRNFDYSEYESTVATLRKSLDRWETIKAAPHYDKTGCGINKDSRFSSFNISFSFDSWAGTFGNSGCSTVIYVGNQDIFRTAFLKVLDQKMLSLLAETADQIETDSNKAKADEIARLKERLTKLLEPNRG